MFVFNIEFYAGDVNCHVFEEFTSMSCLLSWKVKTINEWYLSRMIEASPFAHWIFNTTVIVGNDWLNIRAFLDSKSAHSLLWDAYIVFSFIRELCLFWGKDRRYQIMVNFYILYHEDIYILYLYLIYTSYHDKILYLKAGLISEFVTFWYIFEVFFIRKCIKFEDVLENAQHQMSRNCTELDYFITGHQWVKFTYAAIRGLCSW